MSDFQQLAPQLNLPVGLCQLIASAAIEMSKQAHRAYRIHKPGRHRGGTLRPGRQTPLWNELRRQLRSHVVRYGEQANLGRVLGLPRQRVQAFLTAGSEMPDAERTLQLLAWLAAVGRGHRPS